MSGKAWKETLAALGVIASLVFVGWEIRQNTQQARAEAFQAVGIAAAEFHQAIAFDERLSVLWAEHNNPVRLQEWTEADWATYFRSIVGYARLLETVQIQVLEDVLPDDGLERLGFARANEFLQIWGGFACVWPRVQNFVGESVYDLIEEVPQADRFACPADLAALFSGATGGVDVGQ